MIKHHNGLLLIDSTEGVGTTVTVVLPTVKRPQADASDIDMLRLADVSEEKI